MNSLLRRRAGTGLASMASTSQVRLEAATTLSRRARALRLVNGCAVNRSAEQVTTRRAYRTSRSCKGSMIAGLAEMQDSLLRARSDSDLGDDEADAERSKTTLIDDPTEAGILSVNDASAVGPGAIARTPPVLKLSAQAQDPSILSNPIPKLTTPRTTQKLRDGVEIAKKFGPSGKKPHPHLPLEEEWNTAFPRTSGISKGNRWFLSNAKTCKSVVKALKLDQYADRYLGPGEKLTIIEGYAGPGIMTRAFLESKVVEKVVSLEDNVYFAQGLNNLSKDPKVRDAASRLTTAYRSAFSWDTYDDLLNTGTLDSIPGVAAMRSGKTTRKTDVALLEEESWTKPSPVLFFAQLPNDVHSEQLLSQLLRSIANRLWLFRFSRVRIALLCSEHLATRMVAESGKLRGKLTLIAGAQTNVEILQTASDFEPYHEHCWPPVASLGAQLPVTRNASTIRTSLTSLGGTRKSQGAKLGQALVLIEPKVKPLITGPDMDAYDYITKHLLVLRAQPIGTALLHLAPGAGNLLTMLKSGKHPALRDLGSVDIDPENPVNTLPLEHFVAIARIFERWPFRPDFLFEEGRIDDIK